MQQHRLGGGQRQRMAHEGAGEEGRRDLGDGIVAVAPRAAVERVHEARLAGENADRHAAADDLAVGREVGADAEQRLHAAGMDAEAGDDLVEDEGRAAGLGDRAQLLQEVLRPQLGVAALHRLDQHGGDVVAVGLDPVEALRIAVGQDHHVGDRFGRDAGRDRQRARRGAAAGLDQHLVELAVIVVGEHDDALAAGHGARHAHRRHHRFGAGVAEGDALIAGHLRHQRGDLAGQRALRPDREAFLRAARRRPR